MCSAEVPIRGQKSCLERPAGVGPAERLSEDIIEVADEVEHAGSQILERSKAGAFEQPSSEDRELDLDLLEPREVSWRVNKADLVRGILQKRAARLLGLEDPGLALDAERLFEPAVSGHQLDEGCRAVGIELVGDKYPTCIGVGGDSRLDMRSKIGLGSSRPDGRTDNFAGRNLEVGKPEKYVETVRNQHPGFTQPVSPHSLRHTKGMHLLQSGVSLEIIRDFLGHVDVKTTQIYARANLEMKRKALEKIDDAASLPKLPSWQEDKSLLGWLQSL